MFVDLDWHWLLWLLALIPAFYLLVPLVIWPWMRFPAHPDIKELDTRTLQKSLRQFLMTQTNDLFELGFEEPTMAKVAGAPMVTTYLIMLVNRKTGDKAMVTAMVAPGATTMRKNLYLEFSTRFQTGEIFDTLNTTELLALPPEPQAVRTQVPSVIDPKELYDLHRFVMRKHNIRSPKELYDEGEGLKYLVRSVFIESYEKQVDRGWLHYDERRDSYRPTFKGIYLIMWGLMQPMKAFRTLAMRRRAKAILDEFDRGTEQ